MAFDSVIDDVSYLVAIERSKVSGKTKFSLPDRSVENIVHKYFEIHRQANFKSVYQQRMGAHFLDKFIPCTCPMYRGLKAITTYERMASAELRQKTAKSIYDKFIYAQLLAMSSDKKEVFPKEITDEVSQNLKTDNPSPQVFVKIKVDLYAKLHEEYWEDFVNSDHFVRFCQWKYMELITPQQITLNDFSIHRIIGRGGFGEVYGCRKDDSGKMFAMKLLDKKRIKLKKGEALALNEKNMLAKVDNPFVVNLYYAFQTNDKLAFILDLMNGGDLHYHLTQHGVFSEDEVRFYAAELVLALEHIHSQSIVYRDLKPSNILLDEEGHLRLSDLGLACEFKDHHPSSCVGTHGYMAPEVIKKGVQYTYTADWFSLGCVLYKLVTGHGPFRSKSKEEIDKMTLEKEVSFPSDMSKEMKELLGGLLVKDPGTRLGCRGRGSEEVKEVAFFKSTNFDDVLEKRLSPPLIPPRGEVNAADTFEIGNFDDDVTRGIKLLEEDQKIYRRFNMLVSDHWQMEMMDGIFDGVNTEMDKREEKEKKSRKISAYSPAKRGDTVLQGYGHKMSSVGIFSKWERKYFMLYPNRLEWSESYQMAISQSQKVQVLAFDTAVLVEDKELKGARVIRLQQIGSKKESYLRFDSKFEHDLWIDHIKMIVHKSQSMINMGPKVMRDATSVISITAPSVHRQAAQRRKAITQTMSLPAVINNQ